MAFFTSWSNSFTEIFSRAVVRLYGLWCALVAIGERREHLHLLPAMWGSDWGPDYARYWLRPFSDLPVEQMAATPPRELVKLIWRAQASVAQFARYANQSAALFAARRGPRCYRRGFVCDFTGMPWSHALQPWSAVQMIAAHHGGAAQAANTQRVGVPRMRACSARGGGGSKGGGGGGGKGGGGGGGRDGVASDSQAVAPVDAAVIGRRLAGRGRGREGSAAHSAGAGGRRGGGCVLNVVIADRKGRRKLRNLAELVDRCNEWRGPPPHTHLGINCTAHNFGVGLVDSLPTLWRADVFIVPHGADIINGFAMHAGASVVEVMPVKQFQYGCPCDMYRRMYTYEGPTILHYQMTTTNASHAVSTEARKKGTYNSDLVVPWEALVPVLTHVVRVGGKRANYKFRRFEY